MNTSDELLKIFLFQSLSHDQIELLVDFCSIKKVDKGELIFADGQIASAFFYVISGSLKLFKLSENGDEHILHIQKTGDLVAEAVVFDFDTFPANCEALEDSTLIRISKTGMLSLLAKAPEIMFKIAKAYSRRLRDLVGKIEQLSLHDIKSRLAIYLINNCEQKDNKEICTLAITKKDLAAMLGTIPETLSRTLNYFKREGLIREDKNEITILDRSRLKAFASL